MDLFKVVSGKHEEFRKFRTASPPQLDCRIGTHSRNWNGYRCVSLMMTPEIKHGNPTGVDGPSQIRLRPGFSRVPPPTRFPSGIRDASRKGVSAARHPRGTDS
jgi:hypothetical protein